MQCLIVEDHPVIAYGLSRIIESNFPSWRLLQAATVQQAIEKVNSEPIDFALIDLMLPDDTGLTLLGYLRQFSWSKPIASIIISTTCDQEIMVLCKELGARAYIQKKEAFTSILSVINLLIAGGEYFGADNQTSVKKLPDSEIKLTPRQRDLIDLLLDGYSNKKIAYTLDLSYGTVKNYMFDLMRALSVNSRLEMAMKLQQSGYQSRNRERADLGKIRISI